MNPGKSIISNGLALSVCVVKVHCAKFYACPRNTIPRRYTHTHGTGIGKPDETDCPYTEDSTGDFFDPKYGVVS